MKKIFNISEIDYTAQDSIEFEATVTEVSYEGNKETKRPIIAVVKLENSGESLKITSWTYDLLQLLKDAVNSTEILNFEGFAGLFRDKQQQIRIGSASLTGQQSTKKIIKINDILSLKREYNSILNQFIVTPEIRGLLDALVMNNPFFFEWPAATKLHHNYGGGLATHTLQVIKHSIGMWKEYSASVNLDIEVIIAGAMLHDVGKLSEYKKDGSRESYGNIIPHIVDGSDRIVEFCIRNNIDYRFNTRLMMIRHIILSHHEKLEFGSPVTPVILEALIVAKADELDSAFEGVRKELDMIQLGQTTEKLLAADSGRFLKWK